jgi:putative chitinase
MGHYDGLYALAGRRKKKAEVGQEAKAAKESHYNESISHEPGRYAGRSRDWGDATEEVQDAVIDELIRSAKTHHLDKHDTALILTIVRHESGFNPDAANKTSSASSLGQFINTTGSEYKIDDSKRFDLRANADAVVRHYMKCKEVAGEEVKTRGLPDTERDKWTYKFYHDGLHSQKKDSGGLWCLTSPTA